MFSNLQLLPVQGEAAFFQSVTAISKLRLAAVRSLAFPLNNSGHYLNSLPGLGPENQLTPTRYLPLSALISPEPSVKLNMATLPFILQHKLSGEPVNNTVNMDLSGQVNSVSQSSNGNAASQVTAFSLPAELIRGLVKEVRANVKSFTRKAYPSDTKYVPYRYSTKATQVQTSRFSQDLASALSRHRSK